jgi:hypothetical protein
MFHQKTNGITTAATAKTLEYFFGGRNGKRRRFFVVEWAKSHVIGTSFFELYKTAYNFHYVNPA